MCKLFCLGYIKSYCYTFIKLIDICSTKLKNTSKVIGEINKSDDIRKSITLYIYKIIYYKNKKNIFLFLNSEYILKYKLNEYGDTFTINQDKIPFINQYINANNEYSSKYNECYKILEKYKNEKFENVIVEDINLEKFGIDTFYCLTSNLILSRLKLKEYDVSPFYINFYKKICLPLFKNHNRIFTAIQFFYNPEKFKKIKNDLNLMDSEYENLKKNKIDLFVIDSEFLNILLFSYRYCLNELNSNNINSIYSFLYNKKNIQNINQYYYPGNDIKNIPIYELYSKIDNHFNKKIKYGCFVCLCKKGYYHSVNEKQLQKYLNQKCQECGEPIGTEIWKKYYFYTKIKNVKRDKYFRIFKKEEIAEQRELNYNYMTIDDFKKEYIEKKFMEEKGIVQIDEDYLKKDNKIIRNLSQVSYRLLNFILYSHLFFAKLYTENKKFDNFLPKNMNWKKILTECWELLKIELNKNNISTIEVFMNYIFFDIFTELNQQSKINDYQTFIDFEKKLDNMIQKKMTDFKEEYKSMDK